MEQPMSTITRPARPAAAPSQPKPAPDGDQRIVIRSIDWDLYDRLSAAVGEGQHLRMAYDGENLEIMTTGRMHEIYKWLLGQIVATVSKFAEIPRRSLGETTWKRPEIARGIEADQCYYFDLAKIAIDTAARARKSNDVVDYPNPDLAIEVDLADPKVDRSAIYAALRVAEIWRFDGESVIIEQLQDDGTYVAVEGSRFLPIKADDVYRWLVEEDSGDETAWERRLEEWARRLGSRD
jgi:Uma2 family endonuclease